MKITYPEVTWYQLCPFYWVGFCTDYSISLLKNDTGPHAGKWFSLVECERFPADETSKDDYSDIESLKAAIEEKIVDDILMRVVLARRTLRLFTDVKIDFPSELPPLKEAIVSKPWHPCKRLSQNHRKLTSQ